MDVKDAMAAVELTPTSSYRYLVRRSRATWRHSRRQLIFAAVALSIFVFLYYAYHQYSDPITESRKHRKTDQTDIFAEWRGREKCGFGSMDLHVPIEPLCTNKTALLSSMTDGGRPGFDMPYYPRGCDLHFYNTREICQIMTRFESVIFFGDSLMRHLISSFSILLRENLESGGQEEWLQDEGAKESGSCTCDGQVQLFFCHRSDVLAMRDIYENDPYSVKCGFLERPDLFFKPLTTWPLNNEELDASINSTISETKPGKPYAFIMGHGLWNELHEYESIAWVDQIQQRITELRPYLNDKALWPRIFISPSAAGENKQDGFILTQGNKQIVKFEKFMRSHTPSRGLDFLGTYNMSVQASIPDGTHSGLRINILKAMTVINWMDMQDTSQWKKRSKVETVRHCKGSLFKL